MPPKSPIYRIHPAIGFARVGGGTDFFLGPEVPGYGPVGAADGVGSAVPPYKQSSGVLKRQAARFRVWRYVWSEAQKRYAPDAEPLKLGTVKKITWIVELANRKASFFEFHGTNGEDPAQPFYARRRNKGVPAAQRAARLDMVPGKRTIFGANAPAVPFTLAIPGIPIAYLGELRTDRNGQLIVLGGMGNSAPSSALPKPAGLASPTPLNHYANNPTWFDDVSDGPVRAEIEFKDGVRVPWDEVEPAWVIVGPPDFAPAIRNVVSLYDTLVDLWIRSSLDLSESSGAPGWMRQMRSDFNPSSGFSSFRPDFVRDIYPLLQAVRNMRWVHEPAQQMHLGMWNWAAHADKSAASDTERKRVFDRLRKPAIFTGLTAGATATMPRLLGDEQISESVAGTARSEGNIIDAASPARPQSAQPGPFSALTVTPIQYAVMRQWMLGKFDTPGWPSSNDPKDLPAPPKNLTPWNVDVAALENAVGGAFFPGIEVGWLIRNRLLYANTAQASLFRINPWQRLADGRVAKVRGGGPSLRSVRFGPPGATGANLPVGAGFFTQQMALPWQADFQSCKKTNHLGVNNVGWWPAQRPDDVQVTTSAVPMTQPEIAAFSSSKAMQRWTGTTAAVPGVSPARSGQIASREEMVAHFQKLGFVRAADAIGDERANRETVHVERERDSI